MIHSRFRSIIITRKKVYCKPLKLIWQSCTRNYIHLNYIYITLVTYILVVGKKEVPRKRVSWDRCKVKTVYPHGDSDDDGLQLQSDESFQC